MDFKPFSMAVHNQFKAMQNLPLFVVDIDGDELYQAYQKSGIQ